ncbi:MAG: DUF4097 family beta strand repeat protein [Oscillospiraceae bacterium]|nr:DUF4097 family beta strand repeat protein [Oscillospiraceae bacterium]
MKKVMIIVAVALVILGAVVCIAAAASMKFDFRKMDNGNYETNTYTVKKKFGSIDIDVTAEKIAFRPAVDGECSVVCFEEENLKHEVSVSNGTLTIKEKDERKWNEHFGFNTRTPEITVYLPGSSYAELSIKTDTGDIDIPADFSFESASIKGDTADIDFYAPVKGLLMIHVTTGDIKTENITAGELDLKATTGHITVESVSCGGDMFVGVSTGKIRLQDISCDNLTSKGTTGDLTMKNVVAMGNFNITRGTGDVEFDACDAAEIYVRTSTGDVTGTLLSEKNFFAKSDTGKVSVPKSVNGGRCEIETDTGKIDISVK